MREMIGQVRQAGLLFVQAKQARRKAAAHRREAWSIIVGTLRAILEQDAIT